jgi:hypothetical protein
MLEHLVTSSSLAEIKGEGSIVRRIYYMRQSVPKGAVRCSRLRAIEPDGRTLLPEVICDQKVAACYYDGAYVPQPFVLQKYSSRANSPSAAINPVKVNQSKNMTIPSWRHFR